MPRKNRACGACGHDPACGFASVYSRGVETWFCHDDDHSCYVVNSAATSLDIFRALVSEIEEPGESLRRKETT